MCSFLFVRSRACSSLFAVLELVCSVSICSIFAFELFLFGMFDLMFYLNVRFECSVICISLNLFKNVRAVEMFVWLLGLVVHLSVFAGWERGSGSSEIIFDFFFSIHERPKRDRRERWLPSIFHFFYFSIRYFRRKGRPRVNLSRESIYQSHILLLLSPFSQIKI